MADFISTPWHAYHLDLRGPNEEKIGHIQAHDFADTPRDHEHLALIVHSVNAHEPMREALAACQALLRSLDGQRVLPNGPRAVSVPLDTRELLKQIEVALAEAEVSGG